MNILILHLFNSILYKLNRFLDLVIARIFCKSAHDESLVVSEDYHYPALNIIIDSILKSKVFRPMQTLILIIFKADCPSLYSALLEIDWKILNSYTIDNKVVVDKF